MCYVVYKGWVPGLYDEWVDYQKQVHKFSGNCYKGYATREEAAAKWRNHWWKKNQMKTLVMLPLLLTVIAGVLYLILV
jgi:viroplasmin and RNaseH domain-containing protein